MASLRFEDLKLEDDRILRAIDHMGFKEMMPVQAVTIPHFLSNKDVCVQACTGSGKTIAFIVPILQILLRRKERFKDHQIGAIVISPTRELAAQSFQVLETFQKFIEEVQGVLVVGGMRSPKEDLKRIVNPVVKIMVGTPGRIRDLLCNHDVIDAKGLEILILDEADVLLDMGFKSVLDDILSSLPKQRRTGMFSATQTSAVREIARAGLRNPMTVTVTSQDSQAGSGTGTWIATPSSLQNFWMSCRLEERIAQLVEFLKDHRDEKCIVFMLTCAAVDFFDKALEGLIRSDEDMKDIKIFPLHGKMVQKKRTAIYKAFVEAEKGVLFCTDVAARGIDIPDVDWIIQYDAPKDPSFFIHRVGRTARAGREGKSLLFLADHEEAYVDFLQIRKVPMQNLEAKTDIDTQMPLARILQMVMSDRDLLEKGTKAFISYLRGYKEHRCRYIFRFDKLDLGEVARSFCLLKLPKVSEIRRAAKGLDFKDHEIDTSKIAYKNPIREKARLLRIQKREVEVKERSPMGVDLQTAHAASKKAKGSGSREKPTRGAEKLKKASKESKRAKRKGRHQELMEEWEELAKETRLYKKLRSGKISRDDYREQMNS